MKARAVRRGGCGARGPAWVAACLLLPSLAPAATNAPPAAEFFNRGAVHYIRDRMEPAKSTVQEGLAAHPDDPALQKLKILLEQPPQQQEQQQQEQQQEQNQDQQKDQQQEQQNQQEQQEQQPQQEPSPHQRQDPQREPEKAEEMTPEEAKMMLDQLAAQEEKLRDQLRTRMARPVPVDKDW